MKIIESIMTKNPCYTAGKKIDVKGLMLHSVGCPQPSATAFINSWNKSSYSSACVHGFIDANTGNVYQTLPWNHRGWHCGGSGNNTHIGVEMCEPACIKYTGGSSFTCSDLNTARECAKRTYNSAVELFAILCKQFGLDPLKDIVSHREGYQKGIATNHADPEHLWKGLGMSYTMDGFRKAVKAKMTGTPASSFVPVNIQATAFKDLSTADFISKIGSLFTADQMKTGVLASVSFAQCILESGWGKSELAQNANNMFGMKKSLSGNTWSGSTWDGSSTYTKQTKEWNGSEYVTKSADFRKYPSVDKSIEDHSAYLLGAKNGSALRYAGLKGCTDYRKAITIIKNGGYATSPTYIEKICSLIEQYNLTKYDVTSAPTPVKPAEPEKEIHVFYPSYTRKDYPDDRRGAGCVWHDQDKHALVVDAYVKNSVPAINLVDYLINSGLKTIDFVGTHAHSDHLGGGFQLLDDSRITVRNVYVYDPNTLKLAGSGSSNARSAQEDKDYLIKFINHAKAKGAVVRYVDNGSTITCGDMQFTVYRDQPKSFTYLDDGNAYAYINDGSLCLYSKQAYYMMSGDACSAEHVEKYNLRVGGVEVGHHGNNGTQSRAKWFINHGCVWAVQCNNEVNGAGRCEFTRYGSGRMREQGVTPWQLDANIYGVIKAGKAVFTQGSNVKSWSCPFGTGASTQNDAVPHYYRVRKTWSDEKSQVGAYSVYNNAIIKADQMGSSYAVFDWNGKEVYRPKGSETPKVTRKIPFLVKINASTMNIRSGANAYYPVVRKCPVGIYTIVLVSNDGTWGKLKSGAGWINLNDPVCSIMGDPDQLRTKPKYDVTTLAKEVIAGKWGNGSARKEALTKAGYDYYTIQKKVNELLS